MSPLLDSSAHGSQRGVCALAVALTACLAVAGSCSKDPVVVSEDPSESPTGTPAAEYAVVAEGPLEYELEGGIKVEIIERGTGPEVFRGDEVLLHYKGTLVEGGAEFDSSYAAGAPRIIPTGRGPVIPGLKRGLVGLRWGTRAEITIPAELGYGERGNPPMIPSGAALCFEVHVIRAQ